MQTVKNLLQKLVQILISLCYCLRSTPLDHSIPSPAELLNSRVYQANFQQYLNQASPCQQMEIATPNSKQGWKSNSCNTTKLPSLSLRYTLETLYVFSILTATSGNQVMSNAAYRPLAHWLQGKWQCPPA